MALTGGRCHWEPAQTYYSVRPPGVLLESSWSPASLRSVELAEDSAEDEDLTPLSDQITEAVQVEIMESNDFA